MPHIPKGTTDTVPLELFEPALEAALQPSADYDVNRWLYVPHTYSEYRYILGTRGLKPLMLRGINPLPPRRMRWIQPSNPPSGSH